MNTPISILLIDDDEVQNFITSYILKKYDNIQVKILLNGQDALEYLEACLQNNDSTIPTHILLDINMPVLGGFGFLKVIQSEKFSQLAVKIAVMSSSNLNSDLEKAFRFKHITHFIEKPLTKEKLNDFMN